MTLHKPTRLTAVDHCRIIYDHIVEDGTTLKDILAPAYWQHVAQKLKAWDRIEVRWPDGTRYVELMVRATGRVEAYVQVMHDIALGDEVEEIVDEASPFEVKWKGPKYKFAVVRRTDGETVKAEFQTKGHAAKWIAGHMKSMAA